MGDRPKPEPFGVNHPDFEDFWASPSPTQGQGIVTTPPRKRWSKRSLGLGVLAVAYTQVAVGFIATGGSSGLLEYGYAWARNAGAPADQIVGVIFIVAAVGMMVCAIGRRWKEQLAGVGFGLSTVPVIVHMMVCFIGMILGDLEPLQYQAALGSQVGIIFIMVLLHDWPDPSPMSSREPPKEMK